jgi:type I restriction enzyme S subunit
MKFVPLKRLVQSARPITYGIVQAGPEVAEGVPYIRPVDMTEHDGCRSLQDLPRTSAEIAAQYRRSSVISGDIVVSIGPSYGKTMIVPDELAGANLTQGTARVSVSSANDARYVRWCLRSAPSVAHWDAAVGGATFRALNLGPLAETPIPLLPLSRQTAIADYLDTEIARIDTLISKKQRLIELVDERFTASGREFIKGGTRDRIQEATLAWAGPVPLDWRQLKIGSFVRVGSGTTPASDVSDYYSDDGVAWVTTAELRETEIAATARSVTDRALREYSALKVFPVGAVLVAMYGATVGRVGMLGIPATTNQACCAIYGGSELSLRFLFWWLVLHRRHLLDLAYGAGQPNISQETIRSLRVPIPDVDTQETMAASLDTESARAGKMKSALAHQIDLLREYRQALITSAVTGELEIPRVAA